MFTFQSANYLHSQITVQIGHEAGNEGLPGFHICMVGPVSQLEYFTPDFSVAHTLYMSALYCASVLESYAVDPTEQAYAYAFEALDYYRYEARDCLALHDTLKVAALD
jgi:hypothetical protein